MLLFIDMDTALSLYKSNFNTSHVTVYQGKRLRCGRPQSISIHLMLLFIQSAFSHGLLSTAISIHLMLLFIGNKWFYAFITSIFQYISCYCLSLAGGLRKELIKHFNTSHVTVYPLSPRYYGIHFPNFNTSHVTVYHGAICKTCRNFIFQYISCYCLSNELTPFYIFLRI